MAERSHVWYADSYGQPLWHKMQIVLERNKNGNKNWNIIRTPSLGFPSKDLLSKIDITNLWNPCTADRNRQSCTSFVPSTACASNNVNIIAHRIQKASHIWTSGKSGPTSAESVNTKLHFYYVVFFLWLHESSNLGNWKQIGWQICLYRHFHSWTSC